MQQKWRIFPISSELSFVSTNLENTQLNSSKECARLILKLHSIAINTIKMLLVRSSTSSLP